ncbi:MAG: substrate-specific activator of APC-dependent proteolysis [Geoglossum simile]|nr:MAG: substrate-specific activator of APC-dependent proteolysis [Geoglossum simile]
MRRSPPEASADAASPPLQTGGNRNHTNGQAMGDGIDRRKLSTGEVVDPDALSRALREFERAGRQRERTPGGSPSRKRQRVYGDRFIPNREGQDLQASFSLLHDDGSPSTPSRSKKRTPHGELHFQRSTKPSGAYIKHCGAGPCVQTDADLFVSIAEEANRTFSTLLRSEIFDTTIPQPTPPTLSPDPPSIHSTAFHDTKRSRTPPGHASSLPISALTPSTPHKNLFSYMSPRHHVNISGHPTPSRTPQSRHGPHLNSLAEIYSLTPVRFGSQRILLSPRKAPRAVSKVPYKVLDAPDLADDFYLNLVDWGSSNVLGVGLGACVYMWNSQSGRVTKLCDLHDDQVTSVNWIQRGSHVAIGTNKGFVQIWDAERCRRLRTMTGHTARVGALAWNDHILTSGSRDRLIFHRDVRQPAQYLRKLVGHKQEVCGLKWNCEDGQLASGGNDNKLMVWDKLNETPLWKFSEHTAAVKAIAWSPHQHGLLASGGGTADRRIKFWNTLTGQPISEIDTGSQVCNLAWSKNSNEIVSTHGYSQNQIVVWKYPSMTQVVSLTGHTYRVLYLAMSPDGQVIVTGAGDETLRFWNCFKKKGNGGADSGRLDGWGVIR